jgi:DNA repair exonuclease SbcCD nuclease subunit
MLIRVLSDIHNEYYLGEYGRDYVIPELQSDKDSLLILAGDIGLLNREHTWLGLVSQCSRQFKHVFLIEGNHEWYHGNIVMHSYQKCITRHELKNVFTGQLILEKEKIAIIGTTLWTDFDGENPIAMFDVSNGLNDYYLIKVGTAYAKLRPEYILALHYKQKKRLFQDIDHYSHMGYKVVVVTHHHPSRQGIVPFYREDAFNAGYVSDLEREVLNHAAAYWICGHCHTAMEYSIGETRVICNPMGYPHESSQGFNPLKTVTIE